MDGIIIINKEKEYTSHDVVAIVKKILGEKIGHTGTLDPNATGVLPLLIGKGTKLSKYLIEHDKTYEATLKLGLKTDTGDIWGNVLEEQEIHENKITTAEINNALKSMLGKQGQIPPMYSAIKIKGKKLYEYARNNQQVELQPRNIEIYNIELQNYIPKQAEITFKISCSKGTYIRTICEQIAQTLNTIGCMKALNRLQVGQFKLEQALTLEQLKQNKDNNEFLQKHIITFEEILKEKPNITLNNKEIELYLNGVKLAKKIEDNVYRVYNENNIFIGTGVVNDKVLKRDIVV